MELLHWTQVDRKRSNSIRHDDPSFVRGYDLDMDDFTALVAKYNAEQLSRPEENRLLDYVMTMLNIVLENPKINPTPEEIPDLTDAMFMDAWGALRHIKDGRKPYSYIYRSAYVAACGFYKRKIRDRKRQEILDHLIEECNAEYLESISTGKTPVAS